MSEIDYEDKYGGRLSGVVPGMSPTGNPVGRGSPGAGAALGALGGGLSSWARGLADKRNLGNQFESQLAIDKNLNPNARLEAGLERNIGGNLRSNLGDFMQNFDWNKPGIEGGGADFFNGLAQAYLRSVTSGVNPALQKESLNVQGIPGLFAPDIKPELKGPGIGEIALGALGGLFGG